METEKKRGEGEFGVGLKLTTRCHRRQEEQRVLGDLSRSVEPEAKKLDCTVIKTPGSSPTPEAEPANCQFSTWLT